MEDNAWSWRVFDLVEVIEFGRVGFEKAYGSCDAQRTGGNSMSKTELTEAEKVAKIKAFGFDKPPHDFECCEPTERKILRTLHYEPSGVDEALQEAKADAWDEGFNNGYDAVVVEKSMRSSLDLRENPYRVAALGDAPESGN